MKTYKIEADQIIERTISVRLTVVAPDDATKEDIEEALHDVDFEDEEIILDVLDDGQGVTIQEFEEVEQPNAEYIWKMNESGELERTTLDIKEESNNQMEQV